MAAKRRQWSELVVHIGAGFSAKERPHIREAMASLRDHLGCGDGNDVGVEVSVQDRGRGEQRVTLRTALPGRPPLVAVAANPDLTRALHEARSELARQLDLQKVARQPGLSRRLRARTFRHPIAGPPDP